MVRVWDLESMARFPVWSECYMRIGELKCPILFFISGLSGAKNGRRHKRMDAPVKGRMWRVQVGKWLDSARDFPYWRHNTFLWTFSTEVYPVPYAFGNAYCDADMLIASRGGVVLGCSRNSSHIFPRWDQLKIPPGSSHFSSSLHLLSFYRHGSEEIVGRLRL